MKLYICIFFLFLASCQPKEPPKDSLFIALGSEVKNLDPRKATDANSMRLVNLIFKGLVKIGPQLNTLPDAAYKWHQKDLTWSFYLKPLFFSNGRKVTKKDISFSFQQFTKKGSPFFSAFKNIQSVKILENKKEIIVNITLKKFSAAFLSSDLPVIKILPAQEIQQSNKSFLNNPIGTGDFKVITHNSREVLLERLKPTINKPKYLSFKIIKDSFTLTQKMLTGKIDIAPSIIPLEKIHQFRKERFNILSQPSLSTTYLLLNLKNNTLKQKSVRKALSLSINKEEILKYKMKNYAISAKSLIQPKNLFFDKKTLSIPYNLKESQKIIQSLNLKNTNLIFSVTNNKNTISKARILASQMNQSGLKVSLESYEWGTFYKDLNQGDYQMALMKWVGVTDPDIYRVAFHSENQAPKGRNRSFYKNKQIDILLEQASTLQNLKKRQLAYNQIQRKIAEDIAIIPLWHDMEVVVTKKNIKNYSVPMNGDFSSLKDVIKN